MSWSSSTKTTCSRSCSASRLKLVLPAPSSGQSRSRRRNGVLELHRRPCPGACRVPATWATVAAGPGHGCAPACAVMNLLLGGRAVARSQPLSRNSWSSSSRNSSTSSRRSGWSVEVGVVASTSSNADLAGLLDPLPVPAQRRQLEVVAALLALAHDRALAPQVEVDLGQLEAVGRCAPAPRGAASPSGVSAVRRRGSSTTASAPPADPAPELVELGDAEAVGVEDDHDRGVGDVDADLDHRRGDQHVERARRGTGPSSAPSRPASAARAAGRGAGPASSPAAQLARRSPRPSAPRACRTPRSAGTRRRPGGRPRPRPAPAPTPAASSSRRPRRPTSVVDRRRPGGSSSSTDTSRSP